MFTDSLSRPDGSTRLAVCFDAIARSISLLILSLAAFSALLVGFTPAACAELRDYTVRWLQSPSQGVAGYELSVGTQSGQTANVFDLGHPTQQSGELRYAMELEDSVDLHLRLRAYGEGITSDYSNEVVVAAASTPGTPDFGVSALEGATGVVSGPIVVVAETFGATESVEFVLDGAAYRIENVVPYSLAGDGGQPGTEYAFDTTALTNGEHTIVAMGYSQDSAGGSAGASATVTFDVDNSAAPPPPPDPDPTPDPDPDPDPDPEPTPDPEPPTGPEGAIAGLFATATGDIVALHVNGMTTVLTNHELAATGDIRPAWCLLDGDADRDLVIGFGRGSDARLLLLHLEDGLVIEEHEVFGAPKAYRNANGETFPACGDVDGDGLEEFAIGLGGGSGVRVWMMDDYAHQYAPLNGNTRKSYVKTLPSLDTFDLEYMRDGSVYPVLADVDGDGRDELIVGRSAGGLGTVSIMDDALGKFRHLDSLSVRLGLLDAVPDPAYQEASGATLVAAGDIDGDGRAEIVVGTGEQGGSLMFVYDDAHNGFAPMAGSANGLEFGYDGYNQTTGSIQPTLADIDDDGLPEIGLGFSAGGEGKIQILDDLTTGFAPLVWTGDPDGLVRAPAGTGNVTSAVQRGR